MDNVVTEVLRYAAFTESGRGGNPAGVVLDARSLSDADMLAIARQVNYSETAFVLPTTTPTAFQVRYFSPIAEVAFCGHATVAAAVALAVQYGAGELDFVTLAGRVTVGVATSEHGLTATLTSPPTRTRPVSEQVLSAALEAIGWQRNQLDPTYPPHVAFAGNEHLMIGVSSLATLAGLDYDFDRLSDLMKQEQWTTVHMLCAEENDVFHVRNAFPPGGVVEDPATGAAAAAFGGYLRSLDLVDLPARLTLMQGAHMGSPSRLIVDIDADIDTVRVTGSASRIDSPSDVATRPTDHLN